MRRYRKIRKGLKRMRAKLDKRQRKFSEDDTEVPYTVPTDKAGK